MFQLGKELKRIFRPEAAFAAPRDGLVGGDLGVLELLTLDMLRTEAKTADIAAGRIGARDRPMLQVRQAAIWRELARRTGNSEALRKAASAAESAYRGLEAEKRPDAFAAARLEQASCALLGAELFGDEGLLAAAHRVLTEVREAAPRSVHAARAELMRGRIAVQFALERGEPAAALTAAHDAAASVSALNTDQRERPARRGGALARLARVDMLSACGREAKDERVLTDALTEAVRAGLSLDPNYEPLSWSRVAVARAEVLTEIGVLTGDVGALTRAVDGLAAVFDHMLRDHSPLDWARAQFRLGQALVALGQATDNADAFAQAKSAYDRALFVLQKEPLLALRAAVAQARAQLVAAQAEATGDLIALAEAEASFRCELAVCDPVADPVAWAVLQMSLAEVYLARLRLVPRDRSGRAKAGVALEAALEVFTERGLRTLADAALGALERLRATA